MYKHILSIIMVLTLSINAIACSSQTVSASDNNKTSTTTTTKTNTKLTENIKNLLEKDVIKSLMGDKTIHEVFQDAINEGQLKELEEYLKKTLNNANLSIDNFTTDEATYEWISNTVTALLKNALTNGLIKKECEIIMATGTENKRRRGRPTLEGKSPFFSLQTRKNM